MLPRLWLITDRRRSGLPLARAIEEALGAVPPGAAAVVLREKDLPGRELVELARRLRAITDRHENSLIVNGRFDVALAIGARGVHLGGDAPPVAAVHPLLPPRTWLGVSLHGEDPVLPEATYAFASPIFPTDSKPGARPMGLDGLKAAVRRSPGVPVIALGGVDSGNAVRCIEAGAFGVAVTGAVFSSRFPGACAARLYEQVESGL